jgi:hypothetical protein
MEKLNFCLPLMKITTSSADSHHAPPARGLKLVKLDNPENFGINAIPMTFIFDEEGKLIHSEMGARDWASEDS